MPDLWWAAPPPSSHTSLPSLKEQDRLGYRAKPLPRFAAFFRDRTAEDLQAADDLALTFQQIHGVGPYAATVTPSHASGDPEAFGLDVWNRKILALRLLGADAPAPEAVTPPPAR
ncbi:hypothetical protein [Streptomyces sp. NPDC006510]|uniref:hypothetical protein n=1 Tax=Streptomyces sp. NPDC006510 TaxID=3155600 RepID=UPI0033B2669D